LKHDGTSSIGRFVDARASQDKEVDLPQRARVLGAFRGCLSWPIAVAGN